MKQGKAKEEKYDETTTSDSQSRNFKNRERGKERETKIVKRPYRLFYLSTFSSFFPTRSRDALGLCFYYFPSLPNLKILHIHKRTCRLLSQTVSPHLTIFMLRYFENRFRLAGSQKLIYTVYLETAVYIVYNYVSWPMPIQRTSNLQPIRFISGLPFKSFHRELSPLCWLVNYCCLFTRC